MRRGASSADPTRKDLALSARGAGRPRGQRHSRFLRRAVLAALLGLLILAPAAQARTAANLSLEVTFFLNGAITITLPDGTPVGSTSGAPTVIPAGAYTLVIAGPGGCSQLPLLYVTGPGVNINDDMIGGEVVSENLNATFLPNSTYVWHTDRGLSSAPHTFVTSATVGGTAGASGSSGGSTGTGSTPTSQDIVGSAIAPFRGTLTGSVSASGRLSVAFDGKSVTRLTAGRYRIAVTDRSSSSGFLLQKTRRPAVRVTGSAFMGKRTVSVELTAGKWSFTPEAGKATYSIVVK